MIVASLLVLVAILLFIVGGAIYDQDTVERVGRRRWQEEQEQSFRDRRGMR